MIKVREAVVKYKSSKTSYATLREANGVAEFVRKCLPDNSREHFIVVHLDGAHTPISWQVIATGTANGCQVHPREVFQAAIIVGSVAIVLAHNHPSGSLTPSDQDKTVTKKLRDAGSILGIRVLDHVIVTDDSFYSFEENGL